MTADPTQVIAGQLEALTRLAQHGEWHLVREFLGRLDPANAKVFVGLLAERGITLPVVEPALTPTHDPTRRVDHMRDPEPTR